MRKVWIVCLLSLPVGLHAEEAVDRLMLEAGIVGGDSGACPGHYVGINGRVAGPLSVYGMDLRGQPTVPACRSCLGVTTG